MNRTSKFVAVIFVALEIQLFFHVERLSAQEVIYVNQEATGANTGTSWNDAYLSLQDALGDATTGDQIWVAKGHYRPDDGFGRTIGDQTESFQLVSGVRIFGGFLGNETRYAKRNVDVNRTFLTGDLVGDDQPDFAFREDNSFHVVTGSDVNSNTLLDGFYITGGFAHGAAADSVGGGILIVNGSPSVMNTVFVSNSAACGGGMYIEGLSPEIVNAVFDGNSAFRGGAICNVDSNPTIINATIVNNVAVQGAGIYNRNSNPDIVNSILAGNGPRSLYLGCQRAGYPCTFSEMDPDVITQSTALSDEVRSHMEAGSIEAALTWVREQGDVVFAEADDSAILFRLRRGPRTWVLGDAALGGGPGGKTAPQFEFGGRQSRSSTYSYINVVGEDTNGDGKRNNRDKKKALLLSPFRFQFDPWDEGPELQKLFESTSAYASEVEFYSNASAGVEKYKIWSDYDVVHVAAHGGRLCGRSSCWNTIGTGTQVDVEALNQSIEPGFDVMNVGSGQYFISLNRDFVRWHYPEGLGRTVLLLSACETGDGANQPDKETIPDLASSFILGYSSEQSILGESVYLGWTEVVPSDLAFNSSIKLYGDMVNNGWPGRIAEKELKLQGLGSGPNGDGKITTLKRWARSGYDLFIREMVTLIGDDGVALNDGGNITSFVDGTLNDDQPDELWIDVLVEGIDDGTEAEYQIRFELDGQSLGPPVPLPSTDVFMKVKDYTYSITDIVSAGRDLSPNETYTLEAIIDMPGGGQSRYEANNLDIDGCFWNLSLTGLNGGTFSGERAVFLDQDGAFLLTLESAAPNPTIQIFIESSSPAAGSFSLSANGNGDGAAVISLLAVAQVPPFQYMTGDVSEIKNIDDVVVFVTPSPSNLGIGQYGNGKMKGNASGSVFGQSNLDPFYPTFTSAGWVLDFAAESGLDDIGLPRVDACTAN